MFKLIFWLFMDALFGYILISTWGELGSYKGLILAIVAWFTWEVIRAFKEWIGK